MCPQIVGQMTTCQIECRKGRSPNAQDAYYYVQCLILYNRARETETSQELNVETVNHGIAFAELVTNIENACMDNPVTPVFTSV